MANKITLRAQWSSRQGVWRIVKKTAIGAGGWKAFGLSTGYASKTECELKINKIIEQFPDQYQEG